MRRILGLAAFFAIRPALAWPALDSFIEHSDLIVVGRITGVACSQGQWPAWVPILGSKRMSEVRGVIGVSRTLKGNSGKEGHLRYRWICRSCEVSRCGELAKWMNELGDGIWYLERTRTGEVTSLESMSDPGFRAMSQLAKTQRLLKVFLESRAKPAPE